MKRSAIALPFLIACSQDADIGIDSTPITCADVGTAEINGHVSDANGDFEFGAGPLPRVQLSQTTDGTPYTAILESNVNAGAPFLRLELGFLCGRAELTSYGVAPVTPQRVDCPFQVTGAVVGRVEFVEAKSGTLIIDDNANCLAGRFAIDFGDGGELAGWFSSAWQ